jgi:ABC-2 type transport system ATP-binding protein
MAGQPPLEARNLCKRYGARDVLARVDLVAHAGHVHGLLGPNGAGKTTLLRILLGLVRREAGSVRLLGCDQETIAGRLPDGVAGFVATPAFYPFLSGRRNLRLLACLDDRSVATGATARLDEVLDAVGLASQADRPVREYSAGMRQRLGVAAVLLRSPRLALLDEPTSSLDPAVARNVRALVRRLAENGAAVIWSSHDLAEVENLCTALTILQEGHVVFGGTVDELRARAPEAGYVLQTSDDRAASALATEWRNVTASPHLQGAGLAVTADPAHLDEYVIALGRAGIAVRGLASRARSLESLFLQLTAAGPSRSTSASVPAPTVPPPA